MVLADTSIWIEHFRRSDLQLTRFLDRGDVVMHPFVIGELVLGNVPKMAKLIDNFHLLPKAIVASADEVLKFIASRKLSGSGIGYVDVHLLAAAALTPETFVWTRDKRLHNAAQSLSLAAAIGEDRR
jgi:predicted nucleic acid-binding protein